MVQKMETKFSLLIFLTIAYNCNGHVPIIGDLFSGAKSVLGGFSHGLNLNIGGHFGLVNKRPPPKQPDETVVVLVEGEDNQNTQPPNGYRPNQNGYNGNNGYNNNGYGPGPNGHRPNHGNENYYGNGNNGVKRPYGHGRPPNNNYGNGNGNYGQHPGHGNKPNKYPSHPNHGNFDRPNNPTQGNDNNYGYNNQNQGNNNNYYNEPPNQGNNNNGFNKPNQGNNFFNKPNGQNQGNNNFNNPRPDQGFNDYGNQNNQGNPNNNNDFRPIDNGQTYKPIPTLPNEFTTKKPKTTEKPENDAPFFVPLNPNETESGGEKTNTDPKRETDDSDDDNFEIDIRIKDQ